MSLSLYAYRYRYSTMERHPIRYLQVNVRSRLMLGVVGVLLLEYES
jgi:hypothetical protein